mmetsp:Transcript_16006/g.38454  ORF Transcript_16006/g.38454 Transcript_16006/m.38454 type:complete len:172 (+) Transcript_16006:100-615(+)
MKVDALRMIFLAAIAAANGVVQGCDHQTELECMRCGYGQDGTPIPEYYCADIDDGCSVEVCCDIRTEETCYNETTGDPYSCVRYDEGGCPCSGENQTKCGVSQFSNGYCTTQCLVHCDWTVEETCYDDNWEPASCKKYEDGPCPTHNSLIGMHSRVERVNYSVREEEEFDE